MVKHKYVAVALLDLSKAFDSVQYNISEKKLFDLGFDEPSGKMLIDFTSSRIQEVCVNNTTSEKIEIYKGVPQGTVLGPILFKIYANDMRQNVAPTYQILQYTDDTMLYTTN